MGEAPMAAKRGRGSPKLGTKAPLPPIGAATSHVIIVT